MSKYILLIYFLIIKIKISYLICLEGENNCIKCNYLTKLCIKCSLDIYIPDNKGGCVPSKTCSLGKNYCNKCSDDLNKCAVCDDGYFPDENFGCSYTDNCELSYKGECLKCKDNFILIGKGNTNSKINNFILCKSLYSDDLIFCEDIDMINGVCKKCKEGFYLGKGDNKCTEIENCFESSLGICTKCIRNYYFNRKQNKCLKQEEGTLYKCLETFNGKDCDICDDDYYLAKDGKCCQNNFCSKVGNSSQCLECINDYYPSVYNSVCSSTKNCYKADTDTGLCLSCLNDFCLDYKDGQCKPNNENNKLKYCRTANDYCFDCFYPYFLGEDLQCSSTRHCAESENGTCISCSDNYYLGLDNICSNIKNCIYSDEYYRCIQCIDKYYLDYKNEKCLPEKENFTNCQYTDYKGELCDKCREDFYLNKKDYLCYSNLVSNNFYKCEETDENGEFCNKCAKNYNLGKKFKRCTKIEGCEISSDEKNCEVCDEDHVLIVNSGKCEINNKIIDDSKIFYYKCNRTNKEGDACEICLDGFILNEYGICVDNNHCTMIVNEICEQCQKKEEDNYNYCSNPYLGCVETSLENCAKCNDIFDFNKCSKCLSGYQLNEKNKCDKIEEEKDENKN